MPTYLHPGVYLEEIPSGSKPIEGVATSVAAFVGGAARGPINEAVLVHGFEDYTNTYGPISSEDDAMGFAVSAFYQNGGKTAYIARLGDGVAASLNVKNEVGDEVLSISASSPGEWGNDVYCVIKKADTNQLSFSLEVGHQDAKGKFVADEVFADVNMNQNSDNHILKRVNGVSKLITIDLLAAAKPDETGNEYIKGKIVSGPVTNSEAAGATVGMVMTLNINGLGPKRITLAAAPADGEALASAVTAAVQALGPDEAAYQHFSCDHDATSKKFTLKSGTTGSFSSVLIYDGDGGPTDLALLMKLNSANATATHGSSPVIPKAEAGLIGQGVPLENGSDIAPTDSDYQTFFNTKLVKKRDVSIIVLPAQSIPSNSSGNQAVDHAISHCEATKSRMVIMDPEPEFELEDADKVGQLALSTSTYGVLYYPWVRIANPFYDADKFPGKSPTIFIAPSGFAAGMWSKIDGRRGVWKAPAGVETALLGTSGLEFDVGDGEQDQLNPNGVNVIRTQPGFGRVIWGARTLATRADPEWRYVPVRRTAIMIEQSIYNGIQWAVFEPNNHILWANLRVNIETFMNGLFRSGAFQGQKASDAYFVRCGLGDTMNQGDIDRGQVIVIVGFAPLKPAEFVIVRIQQKVGQD